MIPELKAIEPQLKQILYGCVEHVQATKAALYLPASYDLTEKKFEVVTSYQFNDLARKIVHGNDDLVDWLAVKRAPFFVNGLTDQRFAEMLFRQGTDRLLVAPLFARGRLIGFIDMRDKAAKKPFDRNDVVASARIADQVLSLLGEKDLFGLAPIKLVDEPPAPELVRPSQPQPPDMVRMSMYEQSRNETAQAGQQPKGSPVSRAALRAISAARELATRIPANPAKYRVSDRDLEIFRLILPAALSVPGAIVACVSLVGQTKMATSMAAVTTLPEDASDKILAHIQTWLRRTRQTSAARPRPLYPFGLRAMPIQSGAISTIQSTQLNSRVVDGLVLTVAFENVTEAAAQQSLQTFLQSMEPVVESAVSIASGRIDRQTIAEKLLEPDFQKCPELAEHCGHVASLVASFASALDLPALQAETIRIAALVHDVGMRLIDYDQIYNKATLTPEEMRAVTEHPIVGAALVEPLLGAEVAQIVLRHHERFDGTGYPSKISGNQIPLGSRVIAIVDAWAAMTAAGSYQRTILVDEATQRLREAAGKQFDDQLVSRFLASLPQIAH